MGFRWMLIHGLKARNILNSLSSLTKRFLDEKSISAGLYWSLEPSSQAVDEKKSQVCLFLFFALLISRYKYFYVVTSAILRDPWYFLFELGGTFSTSVYCEANNVGEKFIIRLRHFIRVSRRISLIPCIHFLLVALVEIGLIPRSKNTSC